MTNTNIYPTQSSKTMNKKQDSQEFKDAVDRLITFVKIRQGFLNCYKCIPTDESLEKANSWISGLEEIKSTVRALHKYGTEKNAIRELLAINEQRLKAISQ